MPIRTIPTDTYYRALFESSMDGVFLTTTDGTIVAANPAACRMFGMTEEEICAAGRDEMTDTSYPGFSIFIEERQRLGRARGELKFRKKDGSTFLGEASSVLLDSGKRAFVIIRDLTGQKQAEEAVMRNKNRLEDMIRHAPIGLAMFDRDMRYVGVSDRWLQIVGGPLQDVAGRSHYDLFPGLPKRWIEAHRRGLAGETVDDVDDWTGPDGTERTIHWKIQPWGDSGTETGGIIIFLEDITDRKLAEKQLRESEERFRNMADNSPVIIWVTGPDARCASFNKVWSDFTGQPVHKALGFGWLDALHPEDTDRAMETFLAAHAGREPFRMEFRLRRADGEYRWCVSSGVPRTDSAGEFYGYVGSIFDITEQKQVVEALQEAKAAAEEASRSKSEFLANISHEIRTPMTVFMAAVEHLLEIDLDPRRRRLLGMADESAQSLLALIDELLDFSRIEAGKMQLEEKSFDLRPCLRHAMGLFANIARKKNLRLELEISEEAPEKLVGDSKRLGQVLINLIDNAVKFTSRGEVRIRVRPRNGFLEFSVADTGIGIPEKKRHLLFQSFTQVDSSLTRRFGGTGLGLAISRGFVELMGGEISVQSEQGKGSVFTFAIPLREEIALPDRRSRPQPEHSGKSQATARVLIAEDDMMIRKMIVTMLGQRGWEVESAESGREALERWQKEDFALILMDVQMPEMNGLEATRQIRKIESGGEKHTIIVGLTAHARSEIKDECLEAGMDRVLTKPLRIKELCSALSASLDKQGLSC
jgi:PAS domain S-box-containing protein